MGGVCVSQFILEKWIALIHFTPQRALKVSSHFAVFNGPKTPRFLGDLGLQQSFDISKEVEAINASALTKDLSAKLGCEGRGMSTLQLLRHDAKYPIRKFTQLLKSHGRQDVIECMRKMLPEGVTGMKQRGWVGCQRSWRLPLPLFIKLTWRKCNVFSRRLEALSFVCFHVFIYLFCYSASLLSCRVVGWALTCYSGFFILFISVYYLYQDHVMTSSWTYETYRSVPDKNWQCI